jgi:hypothetical protein
MTGMNRATKHLLIYFILITIHLNAKGQLSKGGTPIRIDKLKSALYVPDLVIMPSVDNKVLKIKNKETGENRLKPFKFAHSFEVSLNLNNSGVWYNTSKVNVWQLRIRSVGAYSLNLIFNRFRLPENSKLFIINEKSGEIKGAYTSENNSESNIFAIEPIAGDELLLQYEEPVNVPFRGEIEIEKVAHDFIGIVAKDHRPLGISGSCNVNVNCDLANEFENVRDGVCRILINGTDLCTGTLVNNTALDKAPYVLTAYHCLTDSENKKTPEQLAQASVFLFNYESPYCGSVDGDVSHSISGSTLKASFDSLDFSLVRLNQIVPDDFRPYFVGWNRKNTAASHTVCIHHPLGDIKKIAIDNNAPITSRFNSVYLDNGFWNVFRWEYGVTEEGSSGGPLLDQKKRLIGSLTGGDLSCQIRNDNNGDYFSKFALAWEHRKESSKQLKVWLDPNNSEVETLDGLGPTTKEKTCIATTNFKDSDTHATIQISNGITKKGYWGGTNSSGYTEFAEEFDFAASCEISGISLGIARVKAFNSSSSVRINVYEGNTQPELLVKSKTFNINDLYSNAMNFLPFDAPVRTTRKFFISYDISKIAAGDSLLVYIADRKNISTNSLFLKNQDGWGTYNSKNLAGDGSALLMELIACNVDSAAVKDSIPDVESARFYPNPLAGSAVLTIDTPKVIDSLDDVEVFDLLGIIQNIPVIQTAVNQIKLSFSGKRAGVYIVRLKAGGENIKAKIAYVH